MQSPAYVSVITMTGHLFIPFTSHMPKLYKKILLNPSQISSVLLKHHKIVVIMNNGYSFTNHTPLTRDFQFWYDYAKPTETEKKVCKCSPISTAPAEDESSKRWETPLWQWRNDKDLE